MMRLIGQRWKCREVFELTDTNRSRTLSYNNAKLYEQEYYSILKESLVAIAKWTHLFPCRTQKLSTLTPTIVRNS